MYQRLLNFQQSLIMFPLFLPQTDVSSGSRPWPCYEILVEKLVEDHSGSTQSGSRQVVEYVVML